jgi:hypothetical protein
MLRKLGETLLGKHTTVNSRLITLLENALSEVEEEPNPKTVFTSVLGNHILCDTFIRKLDLAEDPTIQYLMLEMIICSIELCRVGNASADRVISLTHCVVGNLIFCLRRT